MLKTDTEKEIGAASPNTGQEMTWVKQAQAGNRKAFERLADLYYGDIFRMIYYRTHNRMDAEDLAQEVFMKAYRGLDSLSDGNHFKGWLFRIAVNRVRDFHRRKKFLHLFKSFPHDDADAPVDGQSPNDSGPLEALIQKRFRHESESFLSRLSRMEKDVFVLRFMDQLQINEIATALNKGESTVKTHLYRALSKFKQDRAFQNFLKGE